jgi:hypothetical protein
MDFIKMPSLLVILDEIKSAKLSVYKHIVTRTFDIEQTHTITFRDQFHYSGIIELDYSYVEPRGTGPDNLVMMFYTDPSFANLIGPYNLSPDQIVRLKSVIRRSGYLPPETNLHDAVRQGDMELVAELLDQNIDPNELDNNGNTALWYIRDRLDILRLLIDNGADLNLQNRKGETILHGAVLSGVKKMVPILLEAGANPNIQDSEGYTALHDSVSNMTPDPDIINLLLEYGANPNIRNDDGETAVDIAQSYDSYMYNFGRLLED